MGKFFERLLAILAVATIIMLLRDLYKWGHRKTVIFIGYLLAIGVIIIQVIGWRFGWPADLKWTVVVTWWGTWVLLIFLYHQQIEKKEHKRPFWQFWKRK